MFVQARHTRSAHRPENRSIIVFCSAIVLIQDAPAPRKQLIMSKVYSVLPTGRMGPGFPVDKLHVRTHAVKEK